MGSVAGICAQDTSARLFRLYAAAAPRRVQNILSQHSAYQWSSLVLIEYCKACARGLSSVVLQTEPGVGHMPRIVVAT
jgi:hypothetical protein